MEPSRTQHNRILPVPSLQISRRKFEKMPVETKLLPSGQPAHNINTSLSFLLLIFKAKSENLKIIPIGTNLLHPDSPTLPTDHAAYNEAVSIPLPHRKAASEILKSIPVETKLLCPDATQNELFDVGSTTTINLSLTNGICGQTIQ